MNTQIARMEIIFRTINHDQNIKLSTDPYLKLMFSNSSEDPTVLPIFNRTCHC